MWEKIAIGQNLILCSQKSFHNVLNVEVLKHFSTKPVFKMFVIENVGSPFPVWYASALACIKWRYIGKPIILNISLNGSILITFSEELKKFLGLFVCNRQRSVFVRLHYVLSKYIIHIFLWLFHFPTDSRTRWIFYEKKRGGVCARKTSNQFLRLLISGENLIKRNSTNEKILGIWRIKIIVFTCI